MRHDAKAITAQLRLGARLVLPIGSVVKLEGVAGSWVITGFAAFGHSSVYFVHSCDSVFDRKSVGLDYVIEVVSVPEAAQHFSQWDRF